MSLNSTKDEILFPEDADVFHDRENDVKLARFNRFSSKASGSLGASQPSAKVVKMALERQGDVKCVSVPDELNINLNVVVDR